MGRRGANGKNAGTRNEDPEVLDVISTMFVYGLFRGTACNNVFKRSGIFGSAN